MARSLNGTTDLINLGSASGVLDITGPMTVSLWFNFTAFPVNDIATLYEKGRNFDGSGFEQILLRVNTSGTPAIEFGDPSGSGSWQFGTNIVAGSWVHATGVFDGTNSTIFVNGVNRGSGASSAPVHSDAPVSLGACTLSGGTFTRFFNGSLAYVGVWNTNLSATDIASLAGGRTPNQIQTASLVGYWPLGGTASPEPDLSGNGNNGTLTGTTFAADPPGIITGFGPGVATTLSRVPAKAFTKKHYYNELEKIREDSIAAKAILDAMDDRGRADHDFELARAVMENFDKNMTPSNYAKAMDAKENLEKARKARDHHYFMDVVKKAWADQEANAKK